jgi:hypothetical protein
MDRLAHQATPSSRLPESYKIVSAMVCGPPRRFGTRYILSAYDGVWETASSIPEHILNALTDDIGNSRPDYLGQVQLKSMDVIREIEQLGLYCCFEQYEKMMPK